MQSNRKVSSTNNSQLHRFFGKLAKIFTLSKPESVAFNADVVITRAEVLLATFSFRAWCNCSCWHSIYTGQWGHYSHALLSKYLLQCFDTSCKSTLYLRTAFTTTANSITLIMMMMTRMMMMTMTMVVVVLAAAVAVAAVVVNTTRTAWCYYSCYYSGVARIWSGGGTNEEKIIYGLHTKILWNSYNKEWRSYIRVWNAKRHRQWPRVILHLIQQNSKRTSTQLEVEGGTCDANDYSHNVQTTCVAVHVTTYQCAQCEYL